MLIALGLNRLCLITLDCFCSVFFKDREIVNISVSFLYRSQTGSYRCTIGQLNRYIGKGKNDTNPVLCKSATVVLDIVKGLQHKNCNIYFDNYYTSVPLLLALAEKGIGACRTIRANCKYYPKDVVAADVKRKPRGTFTWRSNGSTVSFDVERQETNFISVLNSSVFRRSSS